MRSISLLFLTTVFSVLFCACTGRQPSGSKMTITELKCEYRINPLEVEATRPRLSWIIQSNQRDQVQTAYQIIVSSSLEQLKRNNGDLWNSRKVISEQSVHVRYNGTPLRSRDRCWWKVRVWDRNNDPTEWSDPACWEVGLLNQEDWKARWIGFDSQAAPMFRKEFMAGKQIENARAYISGLGYYELYLNGEKVGDHVLDPAQTDYEKRTYYVVYDITGNIQRGINAMGVILGNGWYNQDVVDREKYGWKDVVYGQPRFIAQVHITFSDGSEQLVITDDTWKASGGPIIRNNIYLGECYDARLEKEGWNSTGYNDSAWGPVKIMNGPGGKLVSQKLQPIKKAGIVNPVTISNPQPGVYVYNMGRNFSGWVKIKLKGEKGKTIRLRFAETIFEDGMIDPASTGVYATGVVQTDKYTFRGQGVETWEPRFTYHGFQYVELTGYDREPTLDNVAGVVVNTAVENLGEFVCSDSMLNKIHEAIRRTVLGNFHGIITDCPHRERCQWLGDADIISGLSFYNFDAYLLYAKFVRDIKTGAINGLPNAIAPGRRTSPASADWGRAYVQVPYFLYLYFGDTSIVKEHYNEMIGYMEHVQSTADHYIISEGWGDLFEPGAVKSARTPENITSTAFYYYDAALMAEMAKILRKREDTDRFTLLADSIKTVFIDSFYNAGNKTFGSQTADALSLNFGLVPEGDELAVATSMMKDVTEEHDGHHSTGHMGTKYIYGELSRFGYGETALNMLNQQTYPGFGDLFTRGATTLWEYWGEKEIDETSSGTRSRCHPFQGGFDVWFYDGIAGINPDPDNPGFKHIILKPQPIGNLTFANARFQSVHGLIVSDWHIKDGRFIWEISVPVNTRATVYLPARFGQNVMEQGKPVKESNEIKFIAHEASYIVYSIGSGTYTFVAGKDE